MILPLSREIGLRLVLGTNTKNIVCLLFADPQWKLKLSIQWFTNCYGKPNKKRMSWHSKA